MCVVSEVLSECAIEQRVRRACTAGKKKQALGGQAAVQLYKDTDNREALTEMLIAANFQKASRFKHFFRMIRCHSCCHFSEWDNQGQFPDPSDAVCRAGAKQGE